MRMLFMYWYGIIYAVKWKRQRANFHSVYYIRVRGERREITYAFAQGATEDTGHADYLQDRGLGDEHLVWEEGFSTQSSVASEFWTT